uniref:Reverse transcriptase domain-containing protein n=1 Tax=Cotesia sesamiae Mombasa bracovirus TaxID=452649 RepID=R9XJ63_9VIRU|nr:hypothetical protein CsmBAC4b19.2 [Cotesia sesamiae] [Cotesia sesamiae Mombasa bracovirus]
MARKTEDSKAFPDAVRSATANIGTVKTLTPITTIEILDLDEISTESEVREALKREFKDSLEIKRVNLTKPTPRGNRAAFCEIDEANATKALNKARIKIGWVNCRIRPVAKVTRCFKCLGFGHRTENCTGPDRSKCCYKCGEDNHKSTNCVEKPKCFLCTVDKDAQDGLGHIAGSGACKAFRTALAAAERCEGKGNRCALAQNLLRQRIFEDKIDICLICEQYVNIQGNTWFADKSDTAAIWIINSKKVTVNDSGEGFVWIKTPKTYFVSVYLSPNEGISVFRQKMANIEDTIGKFDGEVIVAGDFNAKSAEWSAEPSDTRGDEVADFAARTDFIVLNTGSTTTFQRPGYRESILDITLATPKIANMIEGWTVSEEYMAATIMSRVMGLIAASCDASMPRMKRRGSYRPVYWWTQDIADLRKKCHGLRRRATRAAKRSPDQDIYSVEYKQVKKTLNKAIKASKAELWKEICNNLNNDLRETICKNWRNNTLYNQITARSSKTIKIGKAPGPDGIPASVIKIVVLEYPHILLSAYNACLATGTFPTVWKRQRLVLLDKGKGTPITPSSFRPLCMLDIAGKLLEKLIQGRLRNDIDRAGGFASNQHGFRKGRSTIDAIQKVIETAREAWSGSLIARKVCLVLTLDIKNAFNSASWGNILDALEHKFDVEPKNLRIVDDYLDERTLIAETREGPQEHNITAGVPQGSIMGPDLWNADYDELLEIPLPKQVKLTGFADDVAATIVVDSAEEAELLVRETIDVIENWLEEHHLQLAKRSGCTGNWSQKTEWSVPLYCSLYTVDAAHSLDSEGEPTGLVYSGWRGNYGLSGEQALSSRSVLFRVPNLS